MIEKSISHNFLTGKSITDAVIAALIESPELSSTEAAESQPLRVALTTEFSATSPESPLAIHFFPNKVYRLAATIDGETHLDDVPASSRYLIVGEVEYANGKLQPAAVELDAREVPLEQALVIDPIWSIRALRSEPQDSL